LRAEAMASRAAITAEVASTKGGSPDALDDKNPLRVSSEWKKGRGAVVDDVRMY
jgi:hypothetical protein